MKYRIRIILILSAISILLGMKARAQVYDGITQPTKFRVWLPVSINLHDSKNVGVAPFVGYKQEIGQRFSITPVLQYNINTETFTPQVWFNANVANKFYVLSRSIYDTRADLYKHTLSATYKLPLGFMVDGTWENLYNGKKFCNGDRLQFVGGWAHRLFVVNAGYSCRAKPGFLANFRWKVTPYDWLQMKYDGGTKSMQVGMALQFNN